MNIIKDMFESRNSELINNLAEAGFDPRQAEEFLPKAAASISETIDSAGIDTVFQSFVSGNLTEFLNYIDVDGISENLDMSKDQVLAGVNAIWPTVSKFIDSDEAGTQLTAATMFSGLAGVARKIFK